MHGAHGTNNVSDIHRKSSHKMSNLANVEADESDKSFLSNGLEAFDLSTLQYSFILSGKISGRLQKHDMRCDAAKSLRYPVIYHFL